MGSAWIVLASVVGQARRQVYDPRLLWAAVALVGVVLAGALIITWADRWRRRAAEDSSTATDHLVSFRDLYEKGELSKEEYERILDRMSGTATRGPKGPAQPANPNVAPPSTTDLPDNPQS
jgi:hypothetical protein